MTGVVNRIPGRFKIWSVLSLAPSGPAFALGKCSLWRSWEERRGELLVRVRTRCGHPESGAGGPHCQAGLTMAWPGQPGARDTRPDTVITGQGEINRCDEANLYKIMLITRVVKSSERKKVDKCWLIYLFSITWYSVQLCKQDLWQIFPFWTLFYRP